MCAQPPRSDRSRASPDAGRISSRARTNDEFDWTAALRPFYGWRAPCCGSGEWTLATRSSSLVPSLSSPWPSRAEARRRPRRALCPRPSPRRRGRATRLRMARLPASALLARRGPPRVLRLTAFTRRRADRAAVAVAVEPSRACSSRATRARAAIRRSNANATRRSAALGVEGPAPAATSRLRSTAPTRAPSAMLTTLGAVSLRLHRARRRGARRRAREEARRAASHRYAAAGASIVPLMWAAGASIRLSSPSTAGRRARPFARAVARRTTRPSLRRTHRTDTRDRASLHESRRGDARPRRA